MGWGQMKAWAMGGGGVGWEHLSDHFLLIILSFRFGESLAAPPASESLPYGFRPYYPPLTTVPLSP